MEKERPAASIVEPPERLGPLMLLFLPLRRMCLMRSATLAMVRSRKMLMAGICTPSASLHSMTCVQALVT